MLRLDDVTLETYAVIVDQALFESEAVSQRRLTRSESEQIAEREIRRACGGETLEYVAALVSQVTHLVLEERGYTSGMSDGPERAFPIDDEREERQSFWRLLPLRQAR